jgi:hypothetical protein
LCAAACSSPDSKPSGPPEPDPLKAATAPEMTYEEYGQALVELQSEVMQILGEFQAGGDPQEAHERLMASTARLQELQSRLEQISHDASPDTPAWLLQMTQTLSNIEQLIGDVQGAARMADRFDGR